MGGARIRCHQVIRLGVRQRYSVQPQLGHQVADERDLGHHFGRHLGAMLLVFGLEFRAAGRQALVPADGGQVRTEILEHPPDRLGETENRVRRLAARIRQTANGMKRAIRVVAAVDQKQFHRSETPNMREFGKNGNKTRDDSAPDALRETLASARRLG